MVAFTGRCLLHRAEIMELQGAWGSALDEARHAAGARHAERGTSVRSPEAIYRTGGDPPAAGRPVLRRGGVPRGRTARVGAATGLALLRLAQGRRRRGDGRDPPRPGPRRASGRGAGGAARRRRRDRAGRRRDRGRRGTARHELDAIAGEDFASDALACDGGRTGSGFGRPGRRRSGQGRPRRASSCLAGTWHELDAPCEGGPRPDADRRSRAARWETTTRPRGRARRRPAPSSPTWEPRPSWRASTRVALPATGAAATHGLREPGAHGAAPRRRRRDEPGRSPPSSWAERADRPPPREQHLRQARGVLPRGGDGLRLPSTACSERPARGCNCPRDARGEVGSFGRCAGAERQAVASTAP